MMGGHGGGWNLARNRKFDKDHKLPPGTIPRALRIATQYKGRVIAYVGITIAGGLLAIVPPLLMRMLVDDAILKRNGALLNKIALAGVMVALAVGGLGLLSRWISSKIGEGLIYDLRVSLFDHVQRMPIAFFTRTQTGALVSRLNNDVVGAQNAMTGTLGSVIDNVMRVGSTIVVMIAIEWRLTALALVVLPAFLIPAKRIGARVQAITRESMALNAAMNSTMQERFNVSGAMVAKLFGTTRAEKEGFADRAARVRDIGIRGALYMRTLFVTLALVAAIGSAMVYWLGGHLAIANPPRLTPGDVVALIAYVGTLYGPLTMLSTARVDLMTTFVSFERVFEVLDLPPSIDDKPDAVVLTGARGHLEFDDVWFRYPRGKEVSLASLEQITTNFEDEAEQSDVLRGVSFVAEPGKTIALVGPSGAGKTTISSLVPRLYDVTRGRVLVDDHDVRDLTMESLRACIGVVSQDPHLFHDTVMANLRFARPEATDEEVFAATKAAQIHDLIASLADGYDTVVGERGYRFSGGEKQRLAIARVLLKAPAIVILDEATAHLDSESEAHIQRALDAALANRTSLVIAHRLSTIVNADEILVIDGGAVVERGRHADLLQRPGVYQDLYTTQFAGQATVG